MSHHVALGCINPVHKYEPPTIPDKPTGIEVASMRASINSKEKHFKNIPEHLLKMNVPLEQTLIYRKPKAKSHTKKKRPLTAGEKKEQKEYLLTLEAVKIGREKLYTTIFPKME